MRKHGLVAALRTARRAATQSPYLRELYADAASTGLDTADDLRRLPPLTKDILREHARQIICSDADRTDLVYGATGGSTGEPSPYYHDTTWWCRATAAAMRGDEWTGWRLGERQASVWGSAFEETSLHRLRRTASERARNFLFVAGFDLEPRVLERKIAQIYAYRPRLVTGYASILRAVAEGILASGRPPLRPVGIVSSAEPLPRETRDLVERAFGAPVFDRYGCRELGIVAQECGEHDGMHIFSPHVYVEVDVDGRPAQPGETGRLLITLLDNDSFPMVRYDVGDRATVAGDGPCPCGMSYPRLARVDGRALDVLWTSSGGALTGVFFPHLMKEHLWAHAFQVVQSEDGSVELRVVTAEPPGPDAVAAVVDAVKDVMGDFPVSLRRVDALERTPSGKVRVTQSRYERVKSREPIRVEES